MMPRPPELKACAAMYCAYIIPSRPLRSWPFQTACRRFSAVSLMARIALPSEGSKFSRETYGSEACARTSKPHCAV